MRIKLLNRFILISIVGVAILVLSTSNATAYLFSASSGDLSASVLFEQDGSNLEVTLTNTSTADVLVPSNVLTAVFFSLAGDPSLTPISAELVVGSTVYYGPDNGGDVGGEWAYASGLSAVAPYGADMGISSAGFGLFGPADRFDVTTNLQGPDSPDGLQYGITSAGDDLTTGNSAVTGDFALIQNSVLLTLGLPEGFTFSGDLLSDISFQYGTSLSEPNVVPEPATMLLLGSGLLGLAGYGRRKKLFKR